LGVRASRLRLRTVAAAWLILSTSLLGACGSSNTQSSPPPQAKAPATEALQPPAVVAQPLPETGHGAKLRVALLLPLSGANAGFGGGMLDAAQMALYDVADDKLELVPLDTKGSAQGAAEAARTALTDGAKLIIGPLLAAEVEAVKPLARTGSVPVLAFSTSAPLAGDGTWLIGFLPRAEIERVVAFAHARGASRFAALAPRTPYGDITVDAMREAAQKDGASLGQIEFFDPAAQDLTPVVQRFAAQSQSIDALLLPEGGTRLKTLAPLLPYYKIEPDKVHFLGTGLWDEPGTGSEPALVGGWFAAPSPAARADFEKRYNEIYHHPPPRLATLAYDATALAAVLAHSGAGDFSVAALTNPSGFAGVDGIFRLLPDGLVQRGLAVLEVHKEGNTVIDPAPETFQALSQ
jgi:ABC-type branched-subunit amino acid transport system substrate-binding protein